VSIKHVLRMVHEGVIIAQDGSVVKIQADTLCIHGDKPEAPAFAEAINKALAADGIAVKPLSHRV
jgi:5-oxoprolinase (ATP-hydrolysing) subunit A